MCVYEKLRAYIHVAGLKPAAVARKAGLTEQTLDDILNGRSALYADELRAICLALNVSPELFMDVEP